MFVEDDERIFYRLKEDLLNFGGSYNTWEEGMMIIIYENLNLPMLLEFNFSFDLDPLFFDVQVHVSCILGLTFRPHF